MEVKGGYNNKALVLLSELIGTAFIMMAVNWGGVTDATPQCVGLMVGVLIQIFGEIGGGHFNPAVTLAVLFKDGKENWMRNFTFTLMIIISQGIGGVIGTAIAAGGFSFTKQGDAKKITENGYHVAQLCPSGGCNDGGDLLLKVVICEAACTFLFISFVLMIKYHNKAEEHPINAVAIGFMLYLAITMASGISGGCINPVVGLFQSIFQKMANTAIFPNAPETSLVYTGAYIGGPFLGGFIAGMFHKWIHEKAIMSAEEQKDAEYGKMIS